MITMETATLEDWTETNNRLAAAAPREIGGTVFRIDLPVNAPASTPELVA